MRRGIAVGIVALALFILSPVLSASAVTTTVTKLPVTGSYKEMLSVDGDWVVWQDFRNDPSGSMSDIDIYGFNLATGQESGLATGTGSQRWPAISGDNLVWWYPYKYGEGVHGRDLSTGETYVVRAEKARCPDISGDIVVWEDYRSAPATAFEPLTFGDIYAFDLTTKTEIPVAIAAGFQCEPMVWGDWVVWTDLGTNAANGRVRGKNIATGETFTVGATPGRRQGYPHVADGLVVFQATTPAGDCDQYAYDLYAKRTYPIATGPGMDTCGDVGGGVVAWLGDSGGRHTIKGYDTVSGTPFTIVPPGTLSASYFGGLSNGNIAWIGTSAVYGSSGVFITHTTEVEGVMGAGRYETSVKASEAAFPSPEMPSALRALGPASVVETIVVATGENWPDGLGGGALAGALDGPLLLTTRNYLPPVVVDEIKRLNPKAAVILGSESVVSTAVAQQLEALVGEGGVGRIAGVNRYETASLVASEVIAVQGDAYDGTAFVATGGNFADALSASAVAAAKGWPVYLCPPAGLTATDVANLGSKGVKQAVLLGSPLAVSSGTQARLETALGKANVRRLEGGNRYATCAAIANWAVKEKGIFAWSDFALTTGQAFPDGLSASVLQGKAGAPVLLTPTATLAPETAGLLKTNAPSISRFKYVGGAVSLPVRASVRGIVH